MSDEVAQAPESGSSSDSEGGESRPRSKFPKERDFSEERSRSRSRSIDRNKRRGGRFQGRKKEFKVVRPSLAGGMLSFKQFMELQHFPISPFEAQKYYDEYKEQYEKKHLEIFFNEHKDEHWFTEKYDPIVSQRWQEERQLNAKVSHKMFIETARAHGFAGLKLRDTHEGVSKISGPPYFGFDPNSMTLFLKTIPVNISRWDLLNVVKTSPGFVSLSMSEPLKTQGFCRFAWVLYDSEEHCNDSLTLLTNKPVTGDFRLSPVRSQSSSKREVKLLPPQQPEYLFIDWKQTAKLISVIDREKGIQENPLLISEEKFSSLLDEEKEFQLDLHLLYLRRVHAFCYYCMEEYDDERMLAAKCGPAHIRSRYDPEATLSTSLDAAVEARLNKRQVITKYEQDKDQELQGMLINFENQAIVEEPEKKVRCNLCRKLFRGVEFMRKHLHNKHQDELSKVIKERIEAIKLESYLHDPDKLMNPIQQAGEAFRGGDRKRMNGSRPRRSNPEGPYEDLDDPARHTNKSRRVVDYSDI